ncbi:MAG TPA: serine/threonine-protein kinase, partial [Myxococcota bacterium]
MPEPKDLNDPTASMGDVWNRVSSEGRSSNAVYRLPAEFGRYTLQKRLGVGGMAEAFLALQKGPEGFSKKSVVKRILPHLAEDQRFVQMFQREAKVAALLTHTNVVQIYELGVEGGIHFIAMEYVDGAPLQRLARGAWKLGRAVPLEVVCCAIADAALGLAAAHEIKDATTGESLHVVHRDISPDNLMMNKEGVTKILDFGVAKIRGGEKTATGEVKGKLPFLSPEQVRGEAFDHRADIYSLGVTFYWLVTGKRPFSATGDLPLMESIVNDLPRPPIEHNPQVPQLINDLVMRMLAKDREDRPSSGFEIHDALQDALAQRRSVVVPFVKEMLASDLPLAGAESSFSTPASFLPATPLTAKLKSKSAIAVGGVSDGPTAPSFFGDPPRSPPRTLVDNTLEDTSEQPAVELTEPVREAPKQPRRSAATVVIVVVILALAVALAVAAFELGFIPGTTVAAPSPPPSPPPSSPLLASPSPPASSPSSSPAPISAPPPPPAVSAPRPTSAHPAAAAVSEPEAPIPAASAQKASAEERVEIKAFAPAGVRWVTEGGKLLGTGSGTWKVLASAKDLVATDSKRGVKTVVPLVAGVADYGTVPHGKLQPRANPYADVFLGQDPLGTTP